MQTEVNEFIVGLTVGTVAAGWLINLQDKWVLRYLAGLDENNPIKKTG